MSCHLYLQGAFENLVILNEVKNLNFQIAEILI